jgi:glycerol-3-phosphate dehydrogenase
MLAEAGSSAGDGSGDGRPDGARGPDALVGLERFLEERWRGQRPTIWGDQARQALLNHAIYRGIFDLQGADVPDEAAEPSTPAKEG